MSSWDFDHYLETLGFEAGPYCRPTDPRGTTETSQGVTREVARETLLVLSPRLNPETRELCSKMLQAMKLPSPALAHLEVDHATLKDLGEEFRRSTRVCLLMGFDLAATVLGVEASPALRGRPHFHPTWPTVEFWTTHAPSELVVDASLKRPAWDDIQDVLRRFSEHRNLAT